MHTQQKITKELCLQGASLYWALQGRYGWHIPSGLAFHKAEIMGKG